MATCEGESYRASIIIVLAQVAVRCRILGSHPSRGSPGDVNTTFPDGYTTVGTRNSVTSRLSRRPCGLMAYPPVDDRSRVAQDHMVKGWVRCLTELGAATTFSCVKARRASKHTTADREIDRQRESETHNLARASAYFRKSVSA